MASEPIIVNERDNTEIMESVGDFKINDKIIVIIIDKVQIKIEAYNLDLKNLGIYQ